MRALIVALLLVSVGCGKADREREEAAKKQAIEKAEALRHEAEAARALAEAEAKEAMKKVDDLQGKLTELDKQTDAAVSAIADAKNDAERKAATLKLEELRKSRADLQGEVEAAKAAAAKAERLKGVGISKECLDNPLAKGCS